ncbi:MAG: hypothetical protein KJ052_20820, partial [Candidatus Hydrogenedentes bacterium]|nr:hypothetical protein [Candidatus Hydrogenedentota bacterium]
MRKLIAGLSVAVALALAAPASAQEASLTEVAATQWDAATLDAFASLPVQDGGRVKPLDTYARFELLQISGRRSYEKADGSRISALEWLLDTLFFPGTSETYNVFLVESGEVMQALGLPYEKPRDRYSYKTLAPGRQQLFSLAQQYSHMEENQRTPAQNQMINLAHNISDFEYLTVYLRFARSLFDVPDNELFKQAFPEQPHIHFSDVLEKSAPLFQQLIAGHGTQTEEQLAGVTSFLLHVDAAGSSSIALALIPPADPAQSEWVTPGELLAQSVEHGAQLTPAQLGIVRSLERLEMTKADKTAFADEAAKLHALAAQTAGARGEYKKVPLEVTYYKGQFFLYSWMLYILAFLLAAVSWLRPRNKWLWVLPMVTLALPLLYHSAGIVLRCVIRERPPVSTLYETIVFITAVAVLLALVIELMNRQHIALSLGAFVGVLGLFLADKYEVVEGVDTMPSLIAVLDTNFWLATHVTTVTIGYSAGLLAGFIAHIYLL